MLDVVAGARPRFVVEHAREVEGQGLEGRLGHGVAGLDPRVGRALGAP
jgi:hypothetical protein